MEGNAEAQKDPMSSVSDAMKSAAEGVRNAAEDACQAVAKTAPKIKRRIAEGVYTTSYYTAYGVVYTTLLAKSFIPLDNPLGHGFEDGSKAANDAFAKGAEAKEEKAEGENKDDEKKD